MSNNFKSCLICGEDIMDLVDAVETTTVSVYMHKSCAYKAPELRYYPEKAKCFLCGDEADVLVLGRALCKTCHKAWLFDLIEDDELVLGDVFDDPSEEDDCMERPEPEGDFQL